MRIDHATLITPTEIFEDRSILISEQGKIANILPVEEASKIEGAQFDFKGKIVIPGLIDIHTHGGLGITFGEGNIEQGLNSYSKWVASTGVTGFLCSIAAPNPNILIQTIRDYSELFRIGLSGAEGLGLHLEGPFLSREKKGAFDPNWLREPRVDLAYEILEAGQGWIRQITIAPELQGAEEVASIFQQAEVVVALGHSNADFERASGSLRGSFRHITHTYNAQRGFNHRYPGVLGAVMASDGVSAELIADLIHVHPAAMKILIRCLGIDKVVLITDAMSGAGLGDGIYTLGGKTVVVEHGKATLENGTIAGSTARLNQCVRNINQTIGIDLHKAVRMATLNPSMVIGLDNRLGSIEVGKDGSLAVIDDELNVYMTMVKGKIVHNTDMNILEDTMS